MLIHVEVISGVDLLNHWKGLIYEIKFSCLGLFKVNNFEIRLSFVWKTSVLVYSFKSISLTMQYLQLKKL